MRTRTIEVDLSSNFKSFKTLKYKQLDHNNLLEVVVKDNGKLIDLSSHAISVFFSLPDGQVIQRNTSFKNGKVPVMLENIVLRLPGEVLVEINLLKDSQVVTTFTIYLDVEKSIDRNVAVEGDPVWDVLKDAMSTIESVKDTVDEVVTDVNNVEKDINTAKNDISNIKSDLTPLKSDINTAKNDISNIKSDLTPLKSDINTAKTDISNIKTNVSTAQGNINTINSNIGNIQGDINTINSNITNAQKDISTINSNINTINTNIDTIEGNIDTIEDNIGTIRTDVNNIDSTVNSIRTDANTIMSDINKASGDINTLEENISSANEELNAINSNMDFINNVNESIDNINEELNTLNKLEIKDASIVETVSKNTKVEDVANGYFNQIKFEGKTLVNVVNEPKKSIVTKEQELGDGNWVNTTENALISPSVKGKTLVNLVDKAYGRVTQTFNNAHYKTIYLLETSKLKLGNIYTFIINTEFLEGHDASYGSMNFGFGHEKDNDISSHGELIIDDIATYFIGYDTTKKNQTIIKKVVFNSFSDMNYFKVRPFRTETPSVDKKCNAHFDIQIFEGDLTQTPELIPSGYVEGLKSSFEDKYIPKNLAYTSELTINPQSYVEIDVLRLKPSTEYTIISKSLTGNDISLRFRNYDSGVTLSDAVDVKFNSVCKITTFNQFETSDRPVLRVYNPYSDALINCTDLMILEGDWTSNPPVYQDVINHPNKYKVEYKTIGKNKFDVNSTIDGYIMYDGTDMGVNTMWFCTDYIRVYGGVDYYIGGYKQPFDDYYCHFYDLNKQYIASGKGAGFKHEISTFTQDGYVRLSGMLEHKSQGKLNVYNTTQDVDYEPYKSSTKTLYLNSPLLEGDEIKTIDGKLGHYHKMGKIVLDGSEDWRRQDIPLDTSLGYYCSCNSLGITTTTEKGQFNIKSDRFLSGDAGMYNTVNSDAISFNSVFDNLLITISRVKLSTQDISGFKQWLQQNPTTVVYELANPYFEPLTDNIQFIQAYENGHLQIETNVPVVDVKAEPLYVSLYYLKASTEYLVQFHADRNGEVIVSLDTAQQTVQVKTGINKIYLTTSTNVNPTLKLSGDNIEIKDVMVVERIDNEIEYFEGIKSVGDVTNDISIVTYISPIRFGRGGRL